MAVGLDILIDAGGGGGDSTQDFFTPTNGQTMFTLSATPLDVADVIMYVNGVAYAEGSPTPGYFTVSGTTLTWLDVFVFTTNDDIVVVYFV